MMSGFARTGRPHGPTRTGLGGSIAALVTPFLRGGAIDEDSFIALVQMHVDSQSAGVVVGGTTGEGCALSEEELFRLVTLAVERASGRILVVANTGTASTSQTVVRTQKAASLGVDCCMVVTPYYVRPTQSGLLEHFSAVHAATQVPLILYNVPSRTGVDLLPETVARLAKLERFVAIKDASGDMDRPAKMGPGGLAHLSGNDETVLDHFLHGGCGAISVTANVVPELMARFYDLCFSGNIEAARRVHDQILPLHQALFCTTNPAPIKYALGLRGLCNPRVRLPLVGLSSDEEQLVARALERALDHVV